jgi:SAM-dependent methyltransferase
MLQSRHCPLCGASLLGALLTIVEPDRFETALGFKRDGYRRNWRACSTCLAAINEHLDGNAERLRDIAKNYYEIDLGGGIEAKYRKVMALPESQSDNAGRADRILHKILTLRDAQGISRTAPLKTVDVVAGTGVFLSQLKQLCDQAGIGLDAVAIEPDPIAAAHLRQLGLMRVEETVLDENFANGEFDLVTFNKVLEHIEYPVSVLEQGLRIMNRDTGLLYAEVPDIKTIDQRPSTDNILGALHHHLYQLSSLDLLLNRAGLTSLEIQRIVEPSTKLTVFGFAIAPLRLNLLAQK